MNNLRTVSDTKRAFYSIHTRPVNSVYRRVVEELMVEMHLLQVNEDFRYDPIFALGVVTSFDRFMEGYQPEHDKGNIFNALCQAQNSDPLQMRKDSQRLQELAQSKSAQEMLAWITQAAASGGDELQWQLRNISQNPKFKYSRLFAIGLFTLLELSEGNITQDEASLAEFLPNICTVLNLSESKVQKDLEIYRGNLDKIVQVRQAMEDILESQRKRREAAADEAKAEAAVEDTSDDADPTDTESTSEVPK